jgi:hypothetical protein
MQRITNSSCRFSTVSLVILFIVLFFCTGCNTTKYLSEDQSFYGGSRIKFKPVQKGIGGKGELEKDLEALITPKPNTKCTAWCVVLLPAARREEKERIQGLDSEKIRTSAGFDNGR